MNNCINIFKPDVVSSINKDWISILEAWHMHLNSYCEYTGNDDLPYWHSELSNVGLLASAAYSAGHVALQEYAEVKSKSDNFYNGRADLWIGAENEYYAEFKIGCAELNNNNIKEFCDLSIWDNKWGLAAATNDIERRNLDNNQIGIAGLFLCPIFDSDNLKNSNEIIEKVVNCLYEYNSVDMISYFSIDNNNLPTSAHNKNKGKYFPSVILIQRVM